MNEVESRPVDAYDYGEVTYQFNEQHRDKNPKKSQWDISRDDELTVFRCAAYWKWLMEGSAWGLHINFGSPQYLGTVPDGRQSFIAKFVSADNLGTWHGYPADYISNHHDIPDPEILSSWAENRFISRPKARKIMRGQPCSI
jgi:hypothetical protein